MANEFEHLPQAETDSRLLTFKEILFKYISNLPLFFFSLGIALIVAWAYLRWSTPLYTVNSSMIVKVENAANIKGNDKFSSIFNPTDKINTEDEIDLMRSREFLKRVVDSLHLNSSYVEHGKVRSSEIYKLTPFIIEPVNIADSNQGYSFNLQITGEKSFLMNKETKPRSFYSNIELGGSTFRIVPNPGIESSVGRKYTYYWSPSKSVASFISGRLGITPKSRSSSVLNLSLTTENVDKGIDILNQVMQEYGLYNVEDKSRISENSLKFISDRLGELETDLGIVESNIQDFKKRNQFLDLDNQSQMYLNDINESETSLRTQEMQIMVLDLLDNYIKDKKNAYNLTPTTLGISDQTLTGLVSEYNQLIIKRENELRVSKESSLVVKEIEESIEKTRTSMIENLKNIRQSYVLSKNEIERRTRTVRTEMFSLPEKESRIREIKRQQLIKNELYTFLLQKREETGIQLASTVSNSKIFSEAEGGWMPIFPKKRSAYMLAVFFGLLLPVIIVLIRDLMNDRVTTKADIVKYTKMPVIGELGHNDKGQTLVVIKNSRTILAEQFRIIRSNLQPVLKKDRTPVILVTSSFSGEGKSFAATNLAASIALTGKRTVILEFDLRKPKVVSGLGLQRAFGITHFVIGKIRLEELPIKVPDTDNLFVIACGPTPPNPSEMLLDPKVKELFEFCRDNFDAVVIDTAPVGLVSDAMTLSQFADTTLFVIRQRYTFKKQLQMLEDLYQQKKFPAVSILVNDIKVEGYNSYYGYGGYGYGYGYGYYDNDPSKNKWYNKVLQFIGIK